MLRWLLVLMTLAAIWSSAVHAVTLGPSDWNALSVRNVPGSVTAWLFQHALGTESVPHMQDAQPASILTAGLVSEALPSHGRPGFQSLNPTPSSFWLLGCFLAMLVAVGMATWWFRKSYLF